MYFNISDIRHNESIIIRLVDSNKKSVKIPSGSKYIEHPLNFILHLDKDLKIFYPFDETGITVRTSDVIASNSVNKNYSQILRKIKKKETDKDAAKDKATAKDNVATTTTRKTATKRKTATTTRKTATKRKNAKKRKTAAEDNAEEAKAREEFRRIQILCDQMSEPLGTGFVFETTSVRPPVSGYISDYEPFDSNEEYSNTNQIEPFLSLYSNDSISSKIPEPNCIYSFLI